jgi:hypothetical protein
MAAPWPVGDIDRWLPARTHPETYPGERPAGSYLLFGDQVRPLDVRAPNDIRVFGAAGAGERLDGLLTREGLPPVADRVALLAYGANRNPATLRIKLHNYGYRCPGRAVALPMLRGRITGADVVACGFSGQGYFFGDLIAEPDLTARTRAEVWIGLLDPDQLRVLHDSEIGTGDYVAAVIPGVSVEPFDGDLAVLAYVATARCVVSPALGTPIAFASVEATNRTIRAMGPMQMLDHFAGALGLTAALRSAAGLGEQGDFAATLSRYMNENWWRQFRKTAPPDPGYLDVLRLVADRIRDSALPQSTASRLESRGLTLTTEQAYRPPPTLTWRAHMAML